MSMSKDKSVETTSAGTLKLLLLRTNLFGNNLESHEPNCSFFVVNELNVPLANEFIGSIMKMRHP